LPFGLRTAPLIFNLFAEALHWILESQLGWEFVSHYLDDIIITIRELDFTSISEAASKFVTLTNLLGIPRNDAKDECGQRIIVLGYLLDTNTFEISIPDEKLQKIRNTITEALQKDSMTLREIQVIAGLLSWASPAVQLGWVFCKRLWRFETQFAPYHTQKRLSIPLEVADDLRWWHESIATFNGIRFFDDPSRTPFHLFTDACKKGMGGFYYEQGSPEWESNIAKISILNSFSIPVIDADEKATFDINIYEVRAVRLALEQWGPQWRHQRLVIFTDNNATFRGIQKGYLDSSANNDLRRLLCLAVEYDIELQPHWLAGTSNQLADALSRSDFNSVANWCPHWQLRPTTTFLSYHHLRKSGSMKWNLCSPTKQS
jgi:hypothetical protein